MRDRPGSLGLPSAAAAAAAACAAALFAALATYLSYRVNPGIGLGLVGAVFAVPLAIAAPHVALACLFPLGMLAMIAGGEDTARLALFAGAVPLVCVALLAVLRGEDRQMPLLLPSVLGVLVAAFLSSVGAADQEKLVYLLSSMVAGLAVYLAVVLSARTTSQVLTVIRGISVAASIVGLFALWQYLTRGGSDIGFVTSSGEVVGRSTGGFVHPNQLGGFLVLPAALAAGGVVADRRGRPLHLAAIVLCLVGVFASFSRGAMLGLAVLPLLFVPWRVAVASVPLLALVALLAMPSLVGERFTTLSANGPEVGTRLDIWSAGATMWTEHPLTGVGAGGYPLAYATARVPARQYLPDTVLEPPPHAHNIELNLLAEQGVVGLLAWIALLGGVVRLGLRMRRRAGAAWALGAAGVAGVAGFVVHNQFDLSLVDPVNVIGVFAFAGVIAAAASATGRAA